MRRQVVYPFIELEKYPFEEFNNIIPNKLFVDGLCVKRDEKILFKFVGIVILNSKIIIVFPKGSQIPTNERDLNRKAYILIKTLIRYRKEADNEQLEQEYLGSNVENQSITAAYDILDDFIKNGFIFKQRETHKTNSKGVINWNRTIKAYDPFFSNKRPVYLEFVRRNKHIDVNNIIYRIHKYSVNRATKLLGWLFGLEINDYEELPIDKNEAIHYLRVELQKTFVDREVNLYKTLIKFLNIGEEQKIQHETYTFLTPYFHIVWEEICDFIFNGQKDLHAIIPKPYWNVNNLISYTKQIPDTIFIMNSNVFIIDAKYYKLDKLPGWGDLVKQFFYANTLNVPYNTKNVLVFPSNHEGILIKYLGYSAIEDNNKFGEIKGYTLDIASAMKCYAFYDKSDFQRKLIEYET